MTMKTYSGSCHCGAARFEADMDLAAGSLRCNCSICTKSRAWFAFVTPTQFRLLAGEDALADYQWTPPGKPQPNLHYRFCTTCGIRTFATGKNPKGEDIYAIAIAALDDPDNDGLAASLKYVDGRHDRFDREPDDIRLM
jgi:hypothetical protein